MIRGKQNMWREEEDVPGVFSHRVFHTPFT